jgi:tetratricopeptide (TPR) repeat protein
MNTTMSQKHCPRCKKVDLTDFSTCRSCGTSYDWKPAAKQGGGFGSFLSTPRGAILLVVLVIAPIFSVARNSIVRYMVNQNASIIEETGRTLKQDPSNLDAHLRRAKALAALFLYWDAANEYGKAIQLRPSAELYNKRAEMYEYAGGGDQAKQDREMAAKLTR